MKNEFDELLGKAPSAPPSAEGHRARVRDAICKNPDLKGIPDYELLEYLLFATIPRRDTKPIAKELIHKFGSLSAVLHAEYEELLKVDGLGSATAHLLAYVLPIVLRAEAERYDVAVRLDTPKRAAQYMYARFLGLRKEQMLMASLTLNDAVIQIDDLGSGSIDSVPVDIMKILEVANHNGAKKIILAHNHLGGTMKFSFADIELTSRVLHACLLTGFSFTDHLIFCGKRYYSMFGNHEIPAVLDECARYNNDLTDKVMHEREKFADLSKRLREGNESDEQSIEAILNAYKLLYEADEDACSRMMERHAQTIDEEE